MVDKEVDSAITPSALSQGVSFLTSASPGYPGSHFILLVWMLSFCLGDVDLSPPLRIFPLLSPVDPKVQLDVDRLAPADSFSGRQIWDFLFFFTQGRESGKKGT